MGAALSAYAWITFRNLSNTTTSVTSIMVRQQQLRVLHYGLHFAKLMKHI